MFECIDCSVVFTCPPPHQAAMNSASAEGAADTHEQKQIDRVINIFSSPLHVLCLLQAAHLPNDGEGDANISTDLETNAQPGWTLAFCFPCA